MIQKRLVVRWIAAEAVLVEFRAERIRIPRRASRDIDSLNLLRVIRDSWMRCVEEGESVKWRVGLLMVMTSDGRVVEGRERKGRAYSRARDPCDASSAFEIYFFSCWNLFILFYFNSPSKINK